MAENKVTFSFEATSGKQNEGKNQYFVSGPIDIYAVADTFSDLMVTGSSSGIDIRDNIFEEILAEPARSIIIFVKDTFNKEFDGEADSAAKGSLRYRGSYFQFNGNEEIVELIEKYGEDEGRERFKLAYDSNFWTEVAVGSHIHENKEFLDSLPNPTEAIEGIEYLNILEKDKEIDLALNFKLARVENSEGKYVYAYKAGYKKVLSIPELPGYVQDAIKTNEELSDKYPIDWSDSAYNHLDAALDILTANGDVEDPNHPADAIGCCRDLFDTLYLLGDRVFIKKTNKVLVPESPDPNKITLGSLIGLDSTGTNRVNEVVYRNGREFRSIFSIEAVDEEKFLYRVEAGETLETLTPLQVAALTTNENESISLNGKPYFTIRVTEPSASVGLVASEYEDVYMTSPDGKFIFPLDENKRTLKIRYTSGIVLYLDLNPFFPDYIPDEIVEEEKKETFDYDIEVFSGDLNNKYQYLLARDRRLKNSEINAQSQLTGGVESVYDSLYLRENEYGVLFLNDHIIPEALISKSETQNGGIVYRIDKDAFADIGGDDEYSIILLLIVRTNNESDYIPEGEFREKVAEMPLFVSNTRSKLFELYRKNKILTRQNVPTVYLTNDEYGNLAWTNNLIPQTTTEHLVKEFSYPEKIKENISESIEVARKFADGIYRRCVAVQFDGVDFNSSTEISVSFNNAYIYRREYEIIAGKLTIYIAINDESGEKTESWYDPSEESFTISLLVINNGASAILNSLAKDYLSKEDFIAANTSGLDISLDKYAKSDELYEKADKYHTHAGYSKIDHTHDYRYADYKHAHEEYMSKLQFVTELSFKDYVRIESGLKQFISEKEVSVIKNEFGVPELINVNQNPNEIWVEGRFDPLTFYEDGGNSAYQTNENSEIREVYLGDVIDGTLTEGLKQPIYYTVSEEGEKAFYVLNAETYEEIVEGTPDPVKKITPNKLYLVGGIQEITGSSETKILQNFDELFEEKYDIEKSILYYIENTGAFRTVKEKSGVEDEDERYDIHYHSSIYNLSDDEHFPGITVHSIFRDRLESETEIDGKYVNLFSPENPDEISDLSLDIIYQKLLLDYEKEFGEKLEFYVLTGESTEEQDSHRYVKIELEPAIKLSGTKEEPNHYWKIESDGRFYNADILDAIKLEDTTPPQNENLEENLKLLTAVYRSHRSKTNRLVRNITIFDKNITETFGADTSCFTDEIKILNFGQIIDEDGVEVSDERYDTFLAFRRIYFYYGEKKSLAIDYHLFPVGLKRGDLVNLSETYYGFDTIDITSVIERRIEELAEDIETNIENALLEAGFQEIRNSNNEITSFYLSSNDVFIDMQNNTAGAQIINYLKDKDIFNELGGADYISGLDRREGSRISLDSIIKYLIDQFDTRNLDPAKVIFENGLEISTTVGGVSPDSDESDLIEKIENEPLKRKFRDGSSLEDILDAVFNPYKTSTEIKENLTVTNVDFEFRLDDINGNPITEIERVFISDETLGHSVFVKPINFKNKFGESIQRHVDFVKLDSAVANIKNTLGQVRRVEWRSKLRDENEHILQNLFVTDFDGTEIGEGDVSYTNVPCLRIDNVLTEEDAKFETIELVFNFAGFDVTDSRNNNPVHQDEYSVNTGIIKVEVSFAYGTIFMENIEDIYSNESIHSRNLNYKYFGDLEKGELEFIFENNPKGYLFIAANIEDIGEPSIIEPFTGVDITELFSPTHDLEGRDSGFMKYSYKLSNGVFVEPKLKLLVKFRKNINTEE